MGKPYRLSWKDMQAFRRDHIGTVLKLTQQLDRVAHVKVLGSHLYLISEPEVIRELLIKHPPPTPPRSAHVSGARTHLGTGRL